ncbi:LCP family protein [Leptolyngbya sp. FACHB-261]|nr:LCP family protein [Leptolyngbya sp. FACHB-261]
MMAEAPLKQASLSPEQAQAFNSEAMADPSLLAVPKVSRPVNILVLGVKVLTSDLEEPQQEKLGYHALVDSFDGLTDTMLLLRFEPDTHRLTVLSIPRDTRVEIPGHGIDKINGANAEGGPALSAEAVSNLLSGVPIDRYIRVNVQGLEKLIDALGGVTIHVPERMQYQDDSQHLYINLNPGKQHLNGAKALQFLRFRYDGNGDIGRVQRQQKLMRALLEQTLTPKTLPRLPQLLKIAQAHLDTNLNTQELLALAGFGIGLKREEVQMLMVPGRFSEPGEYTLSYWIVDPDRMQTMAAQHLGANVPNLAAPTPDQLSVAIQDSTNSDAAVGETTRALAQAGYTNVFQTDPWAESLDHTEIIAQQGDLESAQALRDALGFGEVLTEATGNLRSDITVRLGKDWSQQPNTKPRS